MGAPNLTTGVSTFQPPSFAVTPDGKLLMANGMDAVKMFDGLGTLYNAGVPAGPTPTVGSSGAGGAASAGDYACAVRYLDKDGIPGDLSAVTTRTASANQQFDWSDLTDSSDARVTQKQLYRSLVGVPTVLYLVTTLADATTTYTDTKSDATLAASTALPILNPDGSDYARSFGVPPADRPFIVLHADRLWLFGHVIYDEGTVTVSNGSTGVSGSGTSWTTQMAGRYLYLRGDTAAYLISSVTNATTIVLSANYTGSLTSGNSYAIKPDPLKENEAVYSSAWDSINKITPEAVLSTNIVLMQQETDDNDRITGGLTYGGELYCVRQRKLVHIPYVRQPNIDAQPTVVARRGCVNNRSYCQGGDGVLYLIDQYGAWSFNGGSVTPISIPIQDMWRDGTIDFSKSKWFWATAYPERHMVKFFVSLTTDSGTRPMTALCFNYLFNYWWLESYNWELGHGTCLTISGRQRVIVGGEADLIYLADQGNIDGLDSTTESGTLRGTVTSAGASTLTDSTATFPTDVATNKATIAITGGTGKGQIRVVSTRNSGTQLTVSSAWTTQPDTTSTYQIGAIEWLVKMGLFEIPLTGVDTTREIRVVYLPTSIASALDVRRYLDHSTTPANFRAMWNGNTGRGVTFTDNDPDAVVNMHLTRSTASDSIGYAEVVLDSGGDPHSAASRWISPEFRGYQGANQAVIYDIQLSGFGE